MTREEETKTLIGQVQQTKVYVPYITDKDTLQKLADDTGIFLRIYERRKGDWENCLAAAKDEPQVFGDDLIETLEFNIRECNQLVDEYYKVLNAMQVRLAELGENP